MIRDGYAVSMARECLASATEARLRGEHRMSAIWLAHAAGWYREAIKPS